MKSEHTDVQAGTYMPFAVIFKEEGGDRSAFDAAENYVAECFRLHSEGTTMQGRPWVLFNKMTKRVEMLYVKKQLKIETGEKWELKTVDMNTEAEVPGAPSSSKRLQLQDGSTSGRPSEDNTDTPGKKKARVEANVDKAAVLANDEKVVLAETITTFINRAKIAKVQMLSAMGQAGDLETSVSNQVEWAWANTSEAKGKLSKLMGTITDFKACSKFWKDWVVQDQKPWMTTVKKQYLGSVALKELEKVADLECGIKALNKHMAMLKSMHQIKLDNAQDA